MIIGSMPVHHLKAVVLALWAVTIASGAVAQSIPGTLPNRLEVTLERPDVDDAFLQLTFERSGETAEIVGCQTRARNVGCRATRRITLDARQTAALEARWRRLAGGARCRIRRPEGNWKPFNVEWTDGSIRGEVYERGDRGLSARCFAAERLGGFFLRVWTQRREASTTAQRRRGG